MRNIWESTIGAINNDKYVEAMCRNEGDKVRSHIYKKTKGDLYPMCGYGWNRLDGDGFSIFRWHKSRRGTCKTCLKGMEQGKDPIVDGWAHKTKWL